MATIFQRIGRAFKLVENKPVEDASQPTRVNIHIDQLGSSGIENYSGYYSEEYLQNLRGTQAADLWDKMRRSDPKIKMILSAVKNPIKGAHWTLQPGGDGDDLKKHAEFMEQVLFRDLEQPWTQQISEILTMLDFGFSVFEVIHKVVISDKNFGNYNSIAKIAWRSPRTIERWNLDPTSGSIKSVSQYAYGVLGRLVDIPGEFLLVFTHEKEGDNYEGVSALRPCYGPWIRKDKYLRLMAVGIEKHAIPIPYMEVPEGKENSQEFTNAQKILQRYVSHQQQYITYPKGWTLGFAHASTFDASKIREAIDKENVEMSHTFLENFLKLGQSGSGSYTLSYNLSDFFLMGIEHVAKNICETFNRKLIPDLIKMNFGPQESYPQLCCSGITDKPGKEFAEVLKTLTDAKILTPDEDLEINMREKYGLPKKAEAAPILPTPPTPAPQPPKLSENVFRLVEKPKTPRALIGVRSEELKQLMSAMLGDIGTQVIKDLMAKKKRATPSEYLSLTAQVQPKGSRDYKTELQSFLAGAASDALNQVKAEIPGGSKIKLAERLSTVKLDENPYQKLPLSLQKAIDSQVGLLNTFQIQDLLKALFFQFNSSVESTDSDTQLEADLTDSMDKFLEGASIAAGAGNSVSRLVNESRSTFFFDEDVADQIESFTFVNGNPVSPICQDLAGTVFSKDDPNMDRYSPPLHHNCKSYLVTNLNGSGKEIDSEGLKPSKASLEKYITLAETTALNFTVSYIDVSKEAATSADDARRLAQEIVNLETFQGSTETETSYRFMLKDPGQLVEGSLKSFEPLEGVCVYYGKLKPLT